MPRYGCDLCQGTHPVRPFHRQLPGRQTPLRRHAGAAGRRRSAAAHAAGLRDGDDQAVAASVAKMVCSEAFLEVALDNMRIHGGIGFTWEHDAHLYMRRAKTTQLIFGTPDHHAQRLATLVTSSSP